MQDIFKWYITAQDLSWVLNGIMHSQYLAQSLTYKNDFHPSRPRVLVGQTTIFQVFVGAREEEGLTQQIPTRP